jgi:hypothetical protein
LARPLGRRRRLACQPAPENRYPPSCRLALDLWQGCCRSKITGQPLLAVGCMCAPCPVIALPRGTPRLDSTPCRPEARGHARDRIAHPGISILGHGLSRDDENGQAEMERAVSPPSLADPCTAPRSSGSKKCDQIRHRGLCAWGSCGVCTGVCSPPQGVGSTYGGAISKLFLDDPLPRLPPTRETLELGG